MMKFLGTIAVLLGILILLKVVFGVALFLFGFVWFAIKVAAAVIIILFGLSLIKRKRSDVTTV